MPQSSVQRLLILAAFGIVGGSGAFGQTVSCGGPDTREYHCRVNTGHGVVLVQETGPVRCVRGYSWDYDDGEIWVDHGCAAEFALTSRAPVSWEEEEVPTGAQLFACMAANTPEAVYCAEMPDLSAELVRQRGDAKCLEGKTWGVDSRGLWLAKGCAADFVVRQRTQTGADPLSTRKLVECASVEGKRNFCQADARGGAELRAVLGHAPCKFRESWDWNEGGVWVDRGCHALFEVEGAPEAGMTQAMFPRCYLSVGEPLAEEWEAECYALGPGLGKFASCNARNSCAALTGTIRRGCTAKGDAAPAYCEKYKPDEE